MFTREEITIDRAPEQVYEFLSDMKSQLSCWEMLYIPRLERIKDTTYDTRGYCKLGGKDYECIIELYKSRPPSGCVIKIAWENGELAAEWRVIDEVTRTKVELNLEGTGGGLAISGNLRKMAHSVIHRLKHSFDLA